MHEGLGRHWFYSMALDHEPVEVDLTVPLTGGLVAVLRDEG